MLTKEQRIYLILVFVLSLIGALLETLGVSAIMPLFSAMMEPETLSKGTLGRTLSTWFHVSDPKELILIIGAGVILLYLVKNVYFVFLSWVRVKFAYKIKREISEMIMRSYMKRPYDFFLGKSTGELMKGVSFDSNGVYLVLYQGFRVLTDLLTVALIAIFIFVADWKTACCVLSLSGICMILILFFFKKRVRDSGNKYQEYYGKNYQTMMETFQGIKEVFVMRRQEHFVNRYRDTFLGMQRADITVTIAGEAPAYLIEGICVTGLMGFMCVQAIISEDARVILPLMASVAIGAFRILPSLGRISSSVNTMLYYTPTVYQVYLNKKNLEETSALEQRIITEDANNEKIHFEKELELQNISWKYNNTKEYVLKNLSMNISKGKSIGIIGSSGAGKSTLTDIILGLHIPEEGRVLIDGVDIRAIPASWSKLIGYVPQAVYLTDEPIKKNVAFGENAEDIDDTKVWLALERAQLAAYVRELPDGIETKIGERGVRFSGGQQQRIAIARALYREPQILVLDEATSALDNETEASVMEAIEHLHGKITVIIVAHRLTTVLQCDEVYKVENGTVHPMSKDELIEQMKHYKSYEEEGAL